MTSHWYSTLKERLAAGLTVGASFFWLVQPLSAFATGLDPVSPIVYAKRYGEEQVAMPMPEPGKVTYTWTSSNCDWVYLSVDAQGRVLSEGRGNSCRSIKPEEFPQRAFLTTNKPIRTEVQQRRSFSKRVIDTYANGTQLIRAWDADRLFAVSFEYPPAPSGRTTKPTTDRD